MLGLSMASPSNTSIFNPSSLFTKKNFKSSFHGFRIKNSFSVVLVAKREEELKEIRAKSTKQINDEIIDIKGESLMLRLQKSAREEFKSSEFRRMRKRCPCREQQQMEKIKKRGRNT
ncbi:hypothetical protein MKX01_040322 [Papaver californicum]|nr:hypothetical protein MKX01_040322 [Papaver californicum]